MARYALAWLFGAILPSVAAAPPARADVAARPAALAAQVQRAGAALARGDAAAALRDYESAAAQEHGADIEIGIVRSLMLAGQYRRALAFAAHTAQAHPGAREGVRLYAQLLEAGGHARLAARLNVPAAPPETAAPALSTGVLIDGGRHALLPLRGLDTAATTVELRDAHGRPLAAQVLRADRTLGLALLRLASPPGDAPRLAWAARDAFPGAPAFAIGAAAGPWPRLHSGFVGGSSLGIELQGDAAGGAVLDNAGRVIGIALAGDGGEHLASASRLRAWLGDLLGETAPAGAPTMALDAIYENALRVTVQWRATPP